MLWKSLLWKSLKAKRSVLKAFVVGFVCKSRHSPARSAVCVGINLPLNWALKPFADCDMPRRYVVGARLQNRDTVGVPWALHSDRVWARSSHALCPHAGSGSNNVTLDQTAMLGEMRRVRWLAVECGRPVRLANSARIRDGDAGRRLECRAGLLRPQADRSAERVVPSD